MGGADQGQIRRERRIGKKVKIRRKEKIFFAMVTVRRNSTENREEVR